MKKRLLLLLGLLLVCGGGWLFWRIKQREIRYQPEPPMQTVHVAEWVTLPEGEEWLPSGAEIIESDHYYWKNWKRQLNGTEVETLYYATDTSWEQFVKQAHARELKKYERMHSGGGGMFHSFNVFFCIVEQNNAGLQPKVEGVSQIALANGHIKVNVYVSYSEETMKKEKSTYYYIIKLPEGTAQVDEIAIHSNKYNRDEAETKE